MRFSHHIIRQRCYLCRVIVFGFEIVMKKMFEKCFLMLVFSTLSVLSLSAQQHRERWKFEDYFPKDYFYPEDSRDNDEIGEVIFYMRLASITPLRDITPDKGDTIIRLNYFPKFAHPLFVEIRKKDDLATLFWKKGMAVKGYVEHSTYLATSDTGYVDVTESKYYGNVWDKGVFDSGYRNLSLTEWRQMTEILTEIDFVHYRHLNGGKGFRTPYILEYKDDQNNVSFYTECPDDKKENRLANLLVSLVDPDYVDMVVSSDWQKGVRAPTYPGGEKALAAFVNNAVQYPADALRDLVEYTVSVEFIVEKDGSIGMIRDVSWPKLEMDYGFADEVIQVVKDMPKWKPATENGKIVRCYADVSYKFLLPKNIRPQYGHPVLETQRDKRRWEDIEACHRKHLQNPLDDKATLWMGKYYYWEYILEHEPEKTPTDLDSAFYENDWETFYDRTPVVSHPGDSALKYFYKVLEMNPDAETITEIYMPVLQLEQQLHKSHNPLAELPYDTVEGVHFPYSYLINWPEDGRLDAAKDYYLDAWHSFFWVKAFSRDLTKMQEPVIYNNKLLEDEVIFRFSFFPSFHPSVAFRVMKDKKAATLYWKILSGEEGHKPLTASQYEQLLQYMEEVRLDELPHSEFEMMLDGAQWAIERVTEHGFRAYFTNVAGEKIRQVYSFLNKISGVKLKYINEY